MKKGWYGNKIQHGLASKGIKSKGHRSAQYYRWKFNENPRDPRTDPDSLFYNEEVHRKLIEADLESNGMTEEEELEQAMNMFSQVQEENRKNMEQEHQHKIAMNTFTWDEMTSENKQAIVQKHKYSDEDFVSAMQRIQHSVFDKNGNIIG